MAKSRELMSRRYTLNVSGGNSGGNDEGVGHPFELVCNCNSCKLSIYDDELGTIRCPLCFGHLRRTLNLEHDGKGGFWGGDECQGVCGITWTNLGDWRGRPTPDECDHAD